MRTSTVLVLLGLSAIVTAGCGRPAGPLPTSSVSRAGAGFPSPKDAAEALRSPLTLPERQAAASAYLRGLGKEAVPAVMAALPETTERGWSEEALWLAEFIAEFAPAASPEFVETRRKTESADAKFRAWFDRTLRLMAMAGTSFSTKENVEIGFRKERHEKLVQRLNASACGAKP